EVVDHLRPPRSGDGSAVVYAMHHSEGTYHAAEFLHALFVSVCVITPREHVAQRMPLVTRQGVIRRFHEKRIEVIPLAEPCWTECAAGKLAYANVYGGEVAVIPDVALIAYSTPRVPADELEEPLRAAGVDVHRVGDCALPQGLL